jgi:hypothetical protein
MPLPAVPAPVPSALGREVTLLNYDGQFKPFVYLNKADGLAGRRLIHCRLAVIATSQMIAVIPGRAKHEPGIHFSTQ